MSVCFHVRGIRGLPRKAYKGAQGIPHPIGERVMTRRWSTIKVPAEILPKLSELRQRTGKSNWQIITEALSFYESALRSSKHFSSASDLDKIAYYIMKLVTSASYLKFQPTQESLEKFTKVLEQLKERMGVDCQEVIPAAQKLTRKHSGRDIHTFNMSIKSCIIRLIEKLLSD